MKRQVAGAVLALAVGWAAVGLAAPGDLDPSFGTGGIVTTALGTQADRPRAILIEPDGKIVVAGETFIGPTYDAFIARYLLGGALDPSFGTSGVVRLRTTTYDHLVYAIVREADGKLVVAGVAHSAETPDFYLARRMPDGSPDPTFGTNGKVTTNLGAFDVAITMARQDDGKLVVGGRTGFPGNYDDFALVRYLPDGTLDDSFGSGGISTVHLGNGQSSGQALVIQPDGKIVLGGYTRLGTNYDAALLRFDADGWLDPTFGSGGIVTTDYQAKQNQWWALAQQPDGKLVVGGYVTMNPVPNQPTFAAARYLANGALDTTFGSSGFALTPATYIGQADSLALQPDGKLILAGDTASPSRNTLARFLSTGALDAGFGSGGVATTYIPNGTSYAVIARQDDGKLVVASNVFKTGADYDLAVARYFTTRCGDGSLEPGEQCDDGNTQAGDCCTPTCQLEAAGAACSNDGNACTLDVCNGSVPVCEHPAGNAGAACRASAGPCDMADVCDGIAPNCPPDNFQPSIVVCRASAGACDPAESCTGTGPACPADAKSTAVCRPSAGACDVAETCNGMANTCPTDVLVPASTVCRAATGECDLAEACTGASPACPADAFKTSGTSCTADGSACTTDVCDGGGACTHPAGNAGAVCRPSASACDVAEACDGVSETCPTDALVAAGTECRAATGPCDVAEQCDGASSGCPSDTLVSAGTECRAAAGACDVAETCNGTSGTCPADVLVPATTVCRSATGECDLAEACTGTSPACPGDAFKESGTSCTEDGSACTVDVCDGGGACTHPAGNAGTVCRPAAGACDVGESCDGVSGSCPADALVPASTVCRPSAGGCDPAEQCDGATAACPADALAAAESVCRAAAGACDLAEQCSGTNPACPADAKSTAVCRPAAGPCDVTESCNGVANACPADSFVPGGTVCRAAAGPCDVAEACSGSAAACPTNVVLPDSDEDALCDAIDPCTNVGGGRTLGGTNPIPKIVLTRINTDTVPNNDHLTFTGAFVLPASADFGDLNPQAYGARVVLRNRFGVAELDVTLPGGIYNGANTRGWKLTNQGKTWTYTDSTATPIGAITTVNLYDRNTQLPNRVEIRVVGDDGTYPVVSGDEPIDGILTIGGPAQAAAGLCGETAFVPAECFYNLSGNQLTCRQ